VLTTRDHFDLYKLRGILIFAIKVSFSSLPVRDLLPKYHLFSLTLCVARRFFVRFSKVFIPVDSSATAS
jgi:hypothetical protein